MELTELKGIRKLSGVDTLETKSAWGEEGYVVRLDGVNYKFVEDPDDGYRSYLAEVEEYEGIIKNTFEPFEVVCQIVDNGSSVLLEVVDAETGDLILKIGTDNYDDYYPMCIMEYYPENMIINQRLKGE